MKLGEDRRAEGDFRTSGLAAAEAPVRPWSVRLGGFSEAAAHRQVTCCCLRQLMSDSNVLLTCTFDFNKLTFWSKLSHVNVPVGSGTAPQQPHGSTQQLSGLIPDCDQGTG